MHGHRSPKKSKDTEVYKSQKEEVKNMANENATVNTETNATENQILENNQQNENNPTVDELMAQLAAANARADKNKLELDKALKENGTVKKALREKQTAEEAEAEAKAEAQRIADEERENLKKELNHMKATNAYKAIEDEKTVESLIDAVSDADHNAIAQIIANECKKAVAEAEAKWLKDRPRVQHGQYSSMTKEQIMAIPDTEERIKAIAMNKDLF